VALWREALLAQAVLKGQTKGYARHPQLMRFRRSRTPVRAIAAYLRTVHAEGRVRGFKFDIGKIARGGPVERMTVTRGQVRYEWDRLLLKLQRRDPERFIALKSIRKIDPHPLLRIVQGGVEEWERPQGGLDNRKPKTKGAEHAQTSF